MSWLAERAEGDTPFEQVLGLRPELLERYRVFYGELLANDLLDRELLNLVQLRVAQLHGLVESLPREPATDHERACLNYAEKFVMDVHSITDDDAEAVKAGFTEPQFVAFSFALALADGMGRFRLVLGAH
jgi:alkylhydroperoxidase family enzyme